jgi:release factor glutamine methyltransferase
MSIRGLLNCCTFLFQQAGLTNPRLDAEVLLSHCLSIDRAGLYAHLGQSLSAETVQRYCSMAARRLAREPVAYILGRKEFWSLTFEVTSDVLIPRPATETLVEEVLKVARRRFSGRSLHILEIGTGSGAICISIATELQNARITATDISPAALRIAQNNAVRQGMADRIMFLEGNLFAPVSGNFDMIISNPPYIPKDVFQSLSPDIHYEPVSALVAGPSGTEFHSRIIREGKQFLCDGGYLIMEIGDDQAMAVSGLFWTDGAYVDISIINDYTGLSRVALAVKKG